MHIIHVPLHWITLPLFLVGMVILLLLGTGKRPTLHHHRHDDEPDWTVPAIDGDANRNSFFHSWDARIKIASLFCYCFLVVSLRSLAGCGIALVLSLAAFALSRLPWQRAANRLLAMSGFLAMFLVVMPFTAAPAPAGTVLIFPGLGSWPFHLHGLILALTITGKACAIALLMDPLLGSSPLPVTLRALAGLGVPSAVCQMLLLSHRYIFVFLHESRRMYRSMQVRGFRRRTDLATMQAVGNFLGMLLVRSFDRTQRVYDAMLSRGYRGVFPTFIAFAATPKDWAKGAVWLTMGVALLIADRTGLLG
ncbi:MAG: cobalt ECF transporter T component CbiQ [Thermodesulfobacteriota bacterium]